MKNNQQLPFSAPSYSNTSNFSNDGVEVQIYNPYRSTVYQPFTTATPCQYSSQRPGGDIPSIGEDEATGNNNDIIIPDDFGHVNDPGYATSPVGEAWVLLFLGAVLAIYKTFKLRKEEI